MPTTMPETFNLAHLVDAPADQPDPRQLALQERQQAMKKRLKRLRHRMNQRGHKFEKWLESADPYSCSGHSSTLSMNDASPSANRILIQRLAKEIRRLISLPESGPWVSGRVSSLERALNGILRLLTAVSPPSTPADASFAIGLGSSCPVSLAMSTSTTAKRTGHLPHENFVVNPQQPV
ncbi:unnamed protein product [Protopolystoma xenopodis]|uniref:Uncharacterized protein n=1 Tax=Protopolystoma xenopodis TaxID=117903 RepID=A0A448XKL3_9PLAT|nr:unnamed protein product [Protopolystoma xenopodis]